MEAEHDIEHENLAEAGELHNGKKVDKRSSK